MNLHNLFSLIDKAVFLLSLEHPIPYKHCRLIVITENMQPHLITPLGCMNLAYALEMP
jgi:hypothetical protein